MTVLICGPENVSLGAAILVGSILSFNLEKHGVRSAADDDIEDIHFLVAVSQPPVVPCAHGNVQ